jgi:PAS domain S-box-containing protein
MDEKSPNGTQTTSESPDRVASLCSSDLLLLLDTLPNLVVRVDLNGRFDYVNEAYCQTFGRSREDLLGKSFLPLVHPDDLEETQAAMAKLYTSPFRCSLDQRAMTASGWRWFRWTDNTVFDTSGNPCSIIGVGEDITDRKIAETFLREIENKWKNILIHSPLIAIVLGTDGGIRFANRFFLSLTEKKEQEVVGKDWFDLFVPERMRERVRNQFLEAMSEAIDPPWTRFEHPILLPTRKQRLIDWSVVYSRDAEGRPLEATCLGLDITERQEVHSHLEDAYRSTQDIVQSIPLGLLIYRVLDQNQLELIEANPSATALSGRNLQERIGWEFDAVWPKADPSLKENILRAFHSGKEYRTEELYYREREVDGAFSISAFKIGEDRVGVAFDNVGSIIRDREQLRLMAEMLDQAPSYITVHDHQGNLFYANSKAFESHGYSSEEFAELKLQDLDCPEDALRIPERIAKTLLDGEGSFELNHVHRNGHLMPLHVYVRPVHWGKFPALLSIASDLSERRESEKRLEKIAWMLNPVDDALSSESDVLVERYSIEDPDVDPTLVEAVGFDTLHDLLSGFIHLLDTSASVYDVRGNPLLKLTSSPRCRTQCAEGRLRVHRSSMASRDPRSAIDSPDSCWSCAARRALELKHPVDHPCLLGCPVYAVPIIADGAVVAILSMAYGEPPQDSQSMTCDESPDHDPPSIGKSTREHEPRPPFIIEMAKRKLESSARLVGEIVQRWQARKRIDHLNRILQSLRLIHRQMAGQRDPKKLIDQAVSILVSERGFLHAWIITTDTAGNMIEGAQASSWRGKPEMLNPPDSRALPPILIKARIARKLVVSLEPTAHNSECLHAIAHGTMSAPLLLDGVLFGYLAVALLPEHAQLQEEQQLFCEIAQDLAFALHRIQLESKQVKQMKDLILAKEIAENASHARDEFLAVMSHEMRTPLNPIIGFANLMLDDCTDPEQKGYLETIISSAERQLELIDNILDYTRIDKGNLKMITQPCDLLALCKVALQDVKRISHGLILNFNNGLPAWEPLPKGYHVLADRSIILRLLDNLLGNACKYTKDGSVTLTTGMRKESHGKLRFRFEVEDTGIGISSEAQKVLFKPFSQVDASFTRQFEGAGLGLAICRKLAEALGGSIGVRSIPGEGSLFWIEVPLESEEVSRSPKGDAQTAFPRVDQPLYALIVDDRSDNLKLMQSLLSRMGLRHEQARDGKEAVEKAESQRFDIIFMDLAMPVMDGFEATKIILGGDSPNKNTPVVAITANTTTQTKKQCLEAGFSVLIEKPIKIEELHRQILNLTQARSSQD